MEATQRMKLSTSPFDFLRVIEALKNIPRKGWTTRGIGSPESVSDHMYRVAVMIWMVPEIDDKTRMRAMKMALAHDMGEAIIGDIAPSDGIPKEEKHLKERLALKYLACLAKPVNQSFADEIEELWWEFETGDSEAAHLVHSVDALECMDQAVVYEERSQLDKDLGEFMELEPKVKAFELRGWMARLKQERQALWSIKEAIDVVFLFVLGGPGVGKGTQCARIIQDMAAVHVSVGDLLREEAESSTSIFADFIEDSIRNSVIIPADLSIRLIQKKSRELATKGKCIFILDGFPRSLDQARAFEAKISQRYSTILLDCSEEVLLHRLKERSKSSSRIDDNDDAIKKRLRTFSHENLAVEEYLRRGGPVWKEIDASGSVEEVYTSVKVVVEEVARPLAIS